MHRSIAIGEEFYNPLRRYNSFYVDKTDFIRQWWDSSSVATALMRPRRFGKTLTLSMLECFFSVKYAHREDLFEGLEIWKEPRFREIQGTYPVLFLFFGRVLSSTCEDAKWVIKHLILELYMNNSFLLDGNLLSEEEKAEFAAIRPDMPDTAVPGSIRRLMEYLSRYYHKNVILLLDEYDTPFREAATNGYLEEMCSFLMPLLESTFTDNPFLEKGLMMGITCLPKPPASSGLNSLDVITTLSRQYEDCFGFTQEEVSAALEEYGLSAQTDDVKKWYDGYTFGRKMDIYNPWDITNYLKNQTIKAYCVDTSSNDLVGELLRKSSNKVKVNFECLLRGECVEATIDPEVTFTATDDLDNEELWSFLLTTGYLKTVPWEEETKSWNTVRLALTNEGVRDLFQYQIKGWFTNGDREKNYKDFVDALLSDRLETMNLSLSRLRKAPIAYYKPGNDPESSECFFHGLTLAMMVTLDDRYRGTSHQSRYDRCCLVLEPLNRNEDHAILLEFRVQSEGERDLEETARHALEQADEMNDARDLLEKGFAPEQIRKYGFGFRGKDVLILRET